jgi:hypothetical protein
MAFSPGGVPRTVLYVSGAHSVGPHSLSNEHHWMNSLLSISAQSCASKIVCDDHRHSFRASYKAYRRACRFQLPPRSLPPFCRNFGGVFAGIARRRVNTALRDAILTCPSDPSERQPALCHQLHDVLMQRAIGLDSYAKTNRSSTATPASWGRPSFASGHPSSRSERRSMADCCRPVAVLQE